MSADAVGRYRRVYPRLWRHPGFKKLSRTARELTQYLLTGPQTNRIGLFYFSVSTAAEDLSVTVQTVRKSLADVCTTFGWQFDATAAVFYIPTWWRWNAPANENVLKGNLKDLNEIPASALSDAFARNIETLPETFHQTFVDGCRERLREGPKIQNQYQDRRTGAEADGMPSPLAENCGITSPCAVRSIGRSTTVGFSDKQFAIAEECLFLTSAAATAQELIDAFRDLARARNVAFTNPEAIQAVTTALAERRRVGTH